MGALACCGNDGMGVPDGNHAHCRNQGAVVGTGVTPALGVHVDEEAQEGVEVCWGEAQEEIGAGVQMGWHTVRGLQEEGNGSVVSFRMTDRGRPAEEAPFPARPPGP